MSRTVRAGYQRRAAARLPRMTTTNASVDATFSVLPDEIEGLRAKVETALPRYLDDLATLVNVDCGSYTKAGVDRVGRWTARFLERLGADVTIHPNADLGDTVVGALRGGRGGPRLLLIGHLDTVFAAGTVGERP